MSERLGASVEPREEGVPIYGKLSRYQGPSVRMEYRGWVRGPRRGSSATRDGRVNDIFVADREGVCLKSG